MDELDANKDNIATKVYLAGRKQPILVRGTYDSVRQKIADHENLINQPFGIEFQLVERDGSAKPGNVVAINPNQIVSIAIDLDYA